MIKKRHMKNVFTTFLILNLITGHVAATEADSSPVRDAAKEITSNVISFGKNLLGGLSDGVTDGRKSSEGADGAIIVSSLTELESKLEVEVVNVSSHDDNTSVAELSFRNNGNAPVRVINLLGKGALLMIDSEGFAYGLSSDVQNPLEVTVPENAAVKEHFFFKGTANSLSAVRLWGREYTLKN